jgi:arylsulfatase A-like enzyme
MTGLRPDQTRVFDLRYHFRSGLPDVVTLPQLFKRHGYQAVAFGKIFHNDDPKSWSEPLWKSKQPEYHTEMGRNVLRWIDEEFRKLTYVWDLGDGVTTTTCASRSSSMRRPRAPRARAAAAPANRSRAARSHPARRAANPKPANKPAADVLSRLSSSTGRVIPPTMSPSIFRHRPT